MRLDVVTLEAKQLTSCNRHSTLYMDLSPDGRYLVYSGSLQADGSSLYRLDLQNSEAAGEVFYHSSSNVPQLGYLPLQQQVVGAVFPLTAAEARYKAPDYSEALHALVYVSNESGYMEKINCICKVL